MAPLKLNPTLGDLSFQKSQLIFYVNGKKVSKNFDRKLGSLHISFNLIFYMITYKIFAFDAIENYNAFVLINFVLPVITFACGAYNE